MRKVIGFWQKTWLSKLILIGLGLFLWPFVIGGGISYLLARKIRNSLLKWILVLPILGFSILFGTSWVMAITSPQAYKPKPKSFTLVTLSPTSSPSSPPFPDQENTPLPVREEFVTPTPIPKILHKIGECLIKSYKGNGYIIILCDIISDTKGNPYNDITVIVSPSIKYQEEKIKKIVDTIKNLECQSRCTVSVYDDENTARLGSELDATEDKEEWKLEHPEFLKEGGDLDLHSLAYYDSDTDSFDYWVEPSTPTDLPTETPAPVLSDHQVSLLNIKDFEKEAKVVSISDVDKDPYSYATNKVKFKGIISTFIKGEYGIQSVNISDPNDYSAIIVVEFSTNIDLTKINKGDLVTIWGTCGGVMDGTNSFGAKIVKGLVYELYLKDNTTGYTDY